MANYKLGIRAEAALIRAQLKLRRNEIERCFEVYTTIHGSGVFRWFRITYELYLKYKQDFPGIAEVEAVKIIKDGGIEDPSILKLGS